MSTNTQPSEHAMRAAKYLYDAGWIEFIEASEKVLPALALYLDQHAIAPAVAERDAVIGHLLQWCYDLRGEWQWKKDEPRAGNQADYDALCATIEAAEKLLAKGGSHE